MAFAAAMGRTSPAEGTFPPGMLFFIGLRADKTAGARASVQLFFFTAHATIIDSMQRYVEEALCEIEDGPPGARRGFLRGRPRRRARRPARLDWE